MIYKVISTMEDEEVEFCTVENSNNSIILKPLNLPEAEVITLIPATEEEIATVLAKKIQNEYR